MPRKTERVSTSTQKHTCDTFSAKSSRKERNLKDSYFTFDLNGSNAKKNLELKLFDKEFPYKYDLTNKKDLKKYFGILDQLQDTILLKMFWAAVQSIHPDTGIFDGHESIMSKNEAINLFASILFCNKRKNDTILLAAADEQHDDDSDYEDSDTETSE